MINMTQFVTNNADNAVVVNGAKFMVSDEVALKIMQLINIGEVSQPISNVVTKPASTPAPVAKATDKPAYKATKDFVPKYKIEERSATDGTKLFCISRANGWTKSEKSLMNTAIKSLKGIKEIDVAYEKDGVKRSFKAWGYNTESTAKKHIKELPVVFTVAQLNGEA